MKKHGLRFTLLVVAVLLLISTRSYVFGETDEVSEQTLGLRTELPNPFLEWPLPHISITNILRLPDSAWTHNFLGITNCPPYPALIDSGEWPNSFPFPGHYDGNRQFIKPNIPDDQVRWQNRDNTDAFYNVFACYGSNGSLPDHAGTDIRATNRTEVFAAAPADQIDVTYSNGEYRVRLRHPNVNGTGQTWYTYYAHMSGTPYSQGTQNNSIQVGDTIGYVGKNHLHFEVSRGPSYSPGEARNPWGVDIAPYTAGCLWIDATICPNAEATPNEQSEPASNGHFSDILEDDWRLTYIETLYYVGAINGFSDGTFRPDIFVTRAEAAKMVIGGMERKPYYTDGISAFPDVTSSHLFYQYIRDMKELGITNGFSDGTYRPDNTLTRCEAAAFIVRGRGDSPSYTDGFQPFLDIPTSHACYQNTRHLYELGISYGFTDGTYKPDLEISRGSLSVFIVRGLRLWDDKPVFNDVLHDHKFYEYIQSIYGRNITNGCDSSLVGYKRFCPNDLLPREQAAAFVSRALGFSPEYNDGRQSFPDVPATNKFYHQIEHLKELEIISGYNDGTFQPSKDVTRGQFAKMVALGLEAVGITCPTQHTASFPDVPPGSLWYDYVQCLKDLGISSGFSDGQYKFDEPITRAEAAKFMDLAFVQLILTIEQEPEEVVNDSFTTAPSVGLIEAIPPVGSDPTSEHTTIILPNVQDGEIDPDEDIVEIAVPLNAGDQVELPISEVGDNIELPLLDVGVFVVPSSSSGSTPEAVTAVTLQQSALEISATSLGWFEAPLTGTYYIRIANMNEFAVDGVNLRFGVQVKSEQVFLPLVIK